MFVAERFLSNIVGEYGTHPVSTDGGTWYPQACRFLKLDHHIHSTLEKSLIERTMQYIKDRTESFDDYFPCRLKNCKLKHVTNWLNLFVDYHNHELNMLKSTEPGEPLIFFFEFSTTYFSRDRVIPNYSQICESFHRTLIP